MAICKDCVDANGLRAPQTSPCEGLSISVTFASGRTDSSPLKAVDNPQSLIGFDYQFNVGGQDYTVLWTGSAWMVLNGRAEKVFYSTTLGSDNNLCPPVSGWTNINGEFSDFFVERLTPPNPSVDCVNLNATFDTNATGWTVANGAWAADFGGTVKYNTALLGSIQQASILSIGETYTISIDYYAVIPRVACTPTQYAAGFIQISAGTNFYRTTLDDTTNEVGEVKNITIDLTCEGNSTLKIELQDPNQCFGTIQGVGFRGIFIDNICAVKTTNVTNPTGPSPLPSVEYADTADVPSQVNGEDLNTKLSRYQECLATKGTAFYNKVVGGVKCDYRELSKLKLIIGLLGQKDIDRALGCIYDKSTFPTALYVDLPCNVSIPNINEGETSIVLDGDYSRFEDHKITFTIPYGYGSASGFVAENTDIGIFYTTTGAISPSPIGKYYSLHNSNGIIQAPVVGIVENKINSSLLGFPVGINFRDYYIVSSSITQFALFTTANNTKYIIYDSLTDSETFESTIIDAVYDVATDTTTLTFSDEIPGDAISVTMCIEAITDYSNDYLETFINFANRFCADCMVTGPAPTPTAPTTPSLEIPTSPLRGEAGVPITTEFNQPITL